MSAQIWNVPALLEQLGVFLPDIDVQVLESTASTSTALLAQAKSDGSDLAQVRPSRESAAFGTRSQQIRPCLLIAEHQTHGRGRMGRTWSAAPGASLTFSLSLVMDTPSWSGLSLAVGVALAEALDPQHQGIALKWPNDLVSMLGACPLPQPRSCKTQEGAPQHISKLGGILIDTCTVNTQRVAVIGIGLNVTEQPPDNFDQAHGNLQTLLPHTNAAQILLRIAQPLACALKQFEQHGFAPFAPRYAQRDMLQGKRITTTQADVPQGIAHGVSSTGALQVQVQPGGPLFDITHGEISVRLSATETIPC
jgi:BirA family transcriptional regulator, biotin operon repressor / biotin---[acetyl-CoA-carboxylase] ligase